MRILLIAILLLTANAKAQILNRSCPEVVPSQFRQVLQENWGVLTHFEPTEDIFGEQVPTITNVACEQFKKLAVLINKLKATYGNYLIYPRDVVVNMLSQDSNAYNFQGYLNLPLNFFVYNHKDKPLFKHHKHNFAIWAHEYGHSIFNQMMSRYSKKWQYLQKALMKYRNVMVDFTAKHNPLLRVCYVKAWQMRQKGATQEQINQALSRECIQPLNKLREQSNLSVEKVNEVFMGPAVFISSAAKAYNELFADIITVAYYQDGKVIHDALHRSGIKYHKSPHKSLGRDFTTHKNDLDVLERQPDHFIQAGEHNLLSAVRRHVWKYYLSNPIYKQKIGKVVQELFFAMASEINELEKVFRKQPGLMQLVFPTYYQELTPAQHAILKKIVVVMNRNLIKVIDLRLEKL